jgi:hypothetical protein
MKKLLVWTMALLFSLSVSFAFADEKGKSPAGKPMDVPPAAPQKTVEHEVKEMKEKKEKKETKKKAKKKTKKEDTTTKEDKKEDKKDK